jgi:anti-sigma B factor antagonist
MVPDGVERSRALTTIEVVPLTEAASARIVIRGEIDVATSPRLRSTLTTLLAQGTTKIDIDFSGVSFVDSSGLGVLVGALKRIQGIDGGSLRIVGATEFVRKIFEITGLDGALLVDD